MAIALTYACVTDPFPLQANPASGTATATLQVVATNETSETAAPVTLGGMSIQLPVGPGADALTLDTASIMVVPPAGWTQETPQNPAGAVIYTFVPDGGPVTLAVGDSLAFALNSVEVNHAAGSATITVTEGSGGCAPADCPTEPLPVTKFPAGWGIVEFSAVNADVNPGEDASVQWAGPPGATYTLQYYTPATGTVIVPAAGAAALGSTGTYPGTTDPPLPLQKTTVFTLDVAYTAGGVACSAQRQVTVEVMDPAPTITRFDGEVSGPFDAPVLTLSWEASENALRYEISGVSQAQSHEGTLPLPNDVDRGPILPAYTLTAYGAPGLPEATAVFNTPPRITHFTGTTMVNGAGMQLQLSWDTWMAESCTITGVPGVLAASGTHTVTPTVQAPLLSEYTLTAVAGGKSDTSTLSLQWGTQPVAQTQVPDYAAAGIVATPDGVLLAVYLPGNTGVPRTVMFFSGTTLQPLASPPVPAAIGQGLIVIDPAGTRVFIASGATLAAFDAQTFEPVPGWPVALPTPSSGVIAVSASADRVFVCTNTPTVFVVNTQTQAVTSQFQVGTYVLAAAATPDGLQLVFAGINGVYRVDAQTYAPSAPPISLMDTLLPVSIAITPDSAAAAIAGLQYQQPGQLQGMAVVDLRTQAVQVIPLPGSSAGSILAMLAGSPDGSRLYAAVTPADSAFGGGSNGRPIHLSVFLRTVVSGGIGG